MLPETYLPQSTNDQQASSIWRTKATTHMFATTGYSHCRHVTWSNEWLQTSDERLVRRHLWASYTSLIVLSCSGSSASNKWLCS